MQCSQANLISAEELAKVLKLMRADAKEKQQLIECHQAALGKFRRAPAGDTSHRTTTFTLWFLSVSLDLKDFAEMLRLAGFLEEETDESASPKAGD